MIIQFTGILPVIIGQFPTLECTADWIRAGRIPDEEIQRWGRQVVVIRCPPSH